MKLLRLAFALCALALFALPSGAGDEESTSHMLFRGATISANTGAASPWVPVRGANRIMLRTWSSYGGAVGSGDSVYVDSLISFEVSFSDSVSFIARDSAGTLVTYRSGIPTTSAHGPRYPVCADSVLVRTTVNAPTTANVNSDTSYKFVAVANPPLMEPLRPAANGSGTYSMVLPFLFNVATHGDGSILPQYMRVKVRPYKRRVIDGSTDSTQGVKGLRMEAIAIYKNR